MTTVSHRTSNGFTSLIDTLERHAEAGIDPAFDSDTEELERQFAELRFSCNHD
jgi:hypothetical protein